MVRKYAKPGQRERRFHDAQRGSSYVFVKTFNRNGEKIKFYASITVKQDGMEVSISSHYMSKNAVSSKMRESGVMYIRKALLPNSSEWHLAEQQNAVPDLIPTQGNDASQVASLPTVGNSSSTKAAEVNRGYTEGATTTSGNSSATSIGKGSEKTETRQEKSEKTAENEPPSEENESASDAKEQQTVQRRNEPQDIEAQIKHLEEIKDYPGADKKAVQAEIDRLKGLQTDEETGMSTLFEKVTRALEPVTEEEARLRDEVNELLRKAGIPVIDDVEEGQRVLDMVNEARLSKDKKSTRNRLAGDKLQVINCHFKCRWCKGIKRFG